MEPMTPQAFIQKWAASTLKERSASQEHFIDLCRLLGQKTPAEADPHGDWYCFERGASKQGGGEGWADVWMRNHFAWEYKGKHKDLEAAYGQLLRYRESLENPPLLVVCDMERFEVHTNFTGTVKQVHTFQLEDLTRAETREILRRLFEAPEELRPGTQRAEVTEKAAAEFASLAQRLRERGHEPTAVAHFLDRLLFCLFAEDVGMLPRKLFQEILEAGSNPDDLESMLRELFEAMAHGGRFGVKPIHFFNGNLFQDATVLRLERDEIRLLAKIAALDWSQIEPAIFGTLFERGLDPAKRGQLGAHYTDRGSILRVVEPVLMAPLRRAWTPIRVEVEELLAKATAAKNAGSEARYRKKAKRILEEYRRDHLDEVRVLDPACGSGNFLYVALELLHELEKELLQVLADVDKGQMSLDIRVGPHMVHGIEINPFAQELAHVTIWIGHFQWQLRNGFSFETDPVLKPLENIERRDAIVDRADPQNPQEPPWPAATVIVGNPPFLGGKKLRSGLGDDYVEDMFRVYDGRVPREADLVVYWFEKARNAIEAGRCQRAGLLGTNSIRGGASRRVLDRIRKSGQIFMAWSDEPWIVEGAAVRISLVGFDGGQENEVRLDGKRVALIHSDLTGAESSGTAIDLTQARRLKENLGIAFMGDTKGGPFDIPGNLAREWLALPLNPNGRPNSDVVRPWANGLDVTRRPRDMWIIDFGVDMSEQDAALYEAPFQYILEHAKPMRAKNRRKSYRERWWIHVEPRPAMRTALDGLPQYIVTPAVAKHRLFAWCPAVLLPDHQLFAFARADPFFFGVLQSRFHENWSLRKGTSLEDRPRYTATTTFETFPMPHVTAAQRARVSASASRLDELRSHWLAPSAVSDDHRAVADSGRKRPANARKRTKKSARTMTRLYNERPAWLAHAHTDLDRAVASAYGWPEDVGDDDALARLLQLNLRREPV